MTELKPCPICGRHPKRYTCKKNLEDGYYIIYECRDKDHCVNVDGENDLEAIEAWNTRYEPTCERVYGGKKYGSIKWVCSECGYGLGDRRHNYCPNCGRLIKE